MKRLIILSLVAIGLIGFAWYQNRPVEDLASIRDELAERIIGRAPQLNFKDQIEDGFGGDSEISLVGRAVSNPDVVVSNVSKFVEDFLVEKGFKEIPVERRKELKLDITMFIRRSEVERTVTMENPRMIATFNVRSYWDLESNSLVRIRFHSMDLKELEKNL